MKQFKKICGGLRGIWELAHILWYMNNFPMEFDCSKNCFGIMKDIMESEYKFWD